MGASDTDVGQKVQEFGSRDVSPHFPAFSILCLNSGRMLISLNRLKDVTLPVPREESASQDEDVDTKRGTTERKTMSFQPPDGSISEKMRSALMKKVVLEKRRTSSHKKVDFKQVSDPKGIPIRFPCHRCTTARARSCGLFWAFFFRETGKRMVVSLPGLHH